MNIVCDGDALVAYIASKVRGQGVVLLEDVNEAMRDYIFIVNPWLKEVFEALKAVLWRFEQINFRVNIAKDRICNDEEDVPELEFSDEEVLSFENTMALINWLYAGKSVYEKGHINVIHGMSVYVRGIMDYYHWFIHEREHECK